MYKTITVDVDIDVCLDDFNDEELADELKSRGYEITPDELSTADSDLDKFELEYLINLIDADTQSLYNRRVRDKLFEMRYA